MTKIIKEIIIMLLVCLVGLLLFAVVFYEYIPNRKVIPDVAEYRAPEQVQQQKSDDVENRNDQVVLTYKVTGSDLNNYKATKDYVPGKANPFAGVKQDVEVNAVDNNSSSAPSTEGTNNTVTKNTTEGNNTNSNSLIDDGGTK